MADGKASPKDQEKYQEHHVTVTTKHPRTGKVVSKPVEDLAKNGCQCDACKRVRAAQ